MSLSMVLFFLPISIIISALFMYAYHFPSLPAVSLAQDKPSGVREPAKSILRRRLLGGWSPVFYELDATMSVLWSHFLDKYVSIRKKEWSSMMCVSQAYAKCPRASFLLTFCPV
jgi:hypothetical protein